MMAASAPQAKIREDLGSEAGDVAEGVKFLPFPDLEESVREDADIVKSSPLVAPGTPVTGYVYDVATGGLKRIV
jgi:carbonic anhydrase